MRTVQTNIALQMVAALTPGELMDFAQEFEQLLSEQKAITLPTAPEPEFNVPKLAFQILKRHRAKHGISTRGNLHDYLDVAGHHKVSVVYRRPKGTKFSTK